MAPQRNYSLLACCYNQVLRERTKASPLKLAYVFVRYWHLTDIDAGAEHVRFRG